MAANVHAPGLCLSFLLQDRFLGVELLSTYFQMAFSVSPNFRAIGSGAE